MSDHFVPVVSCSLCVILNCGIEFASCLLLRKTNRTDFSLIQDDEGCRIKCGV